MLLVAVLGGCRFGFGGGGFEAELSPPPGTYTEPVWVEAMTKDSDRTDFYVSFDLSAAITEYTVYDDLPLYQDATFTYFVIGPGGERSPLATVTYQIDDPFPPRIRDPYLRINSISPSGFVLEWSQAWEGSIDEENGSGSTDGETGANAASSIEYSAYTSSEENISSLSQVAANGVLVSDWTPGTLETYIEFPASADMVHVNVLARDEDENMSAYLPLTVHVPVLPDAYLGHDAIDQIAHNFGDGSFVVSQAWTPIWNDSTQTVAAADLDGDGDDEIIAGRSDAAMFVRELYLNEDGFGTAIAIGGSLANPTRAIVVADLDENGMVEIITGTGSGTFAYEFDPDSETLDERNDLLDPALSSYSADMLAIGDLDGDGNPDLVAGKKDPGGSLLVFLNDGSGVLAAASQPWTESNPGAIAIADFDADGRDDLFVGLAPGVPRVFLGDPSGELVDTGDQAVGSGFGSINATSVDAGDIDGDGVADIAIGSTSFDSVWTSAQNGFFWYLLQNEAEWQTAEVAVVDLNGDGMLDIIDAVSPSDAMLGANDKMARVYLNEGYGSLSEPVEIGPDTGQSAVAAGRLF